LGLEANSIELTETAALLHDIGLIGFSRKLMDKEYNQLEKQEWAHLSLNPVIAYDFLNKIDDLGDVSVIVRSVHEAFDGSGYPDRLKGDEIPIEARIIRLANDYEILIDKKKATKREALKEFHRTDPILDHLFVRQVVQA
jgi:response regulator RpfG family c-di-GMP phosphodiesterase